MKDAGMMILGGSVFFQPGCSSVSDASGFVPHVLYVFALRQEYCVWLSALPCVFVL